MIIIIEDDDGHDRQFDSPAKIEGEELNSGDYRVTITGSGGGDNVSQVVVSQSGYDMLDQDSTADRTVDLRPYQQET